MAKEMSPQVYARVSGALYLFIILFGAFSDGYVLNTFIVPGNAAATAHNILASPELWRLGVAACLIVPLLAVVQLLPAYLLLRPVSRNLALLMVFFNLVSLSVESVSKLFLLMILPVLQGAGHETLLGAQQTYAFARMMLTAHAMSFNIALIFFSGDCIVSGYLVFKSRYFPRLLGVLLQLAGVCYFIACFSAFFAPAFSDLITPAILLPPLIGETSYCLWLLVMGVNMAKWNEAPQRSLP